MKKQIFIFLWVTLASLLIPAASSMAHEPVQIDMASSVTSPVVGDPFWLAVRFKIQPGWHLYAPNTSEMAAPIEINWVPPPEVKIMEVLWPTPHYSEQGTIISYVYEDEIWILAKAVLEAPLTLTNSVMKANVTWVACQEVCMPGKADLEIDLLKPAVLTSADQLNIWLEKIANKVNEEQNHDWLFPFLLALLGGILLNLMPCVLPVLSLKILDLLKPHNSATPLRHHGWAFTAGVMASFVGLAAVLLSLRAGGQELGWGFQLQSPLFVAGLASLFWILALNLWGVFEIGLIFTRLPATQNQHSLWGTFGNGILACVVASPCTAPFMGTALGFALTQPWQIGVLIFGGLGLGMALPFLVICLWPPLARLLPRPGAWMESLKHLLGFALAATVIWLLWIVGHQQGLDTVLKVISSLLLISVAGWIWGRWAVPYRPLKVRVLSRLGGAVLIAAALFEIFTCLKPIREQEEGLVWQPYTSHRLQQALTEKRFVLIDFTATWCLTCQINKKLVLQNPQVINVIKKLNILPLRADWTNHDGAITQALAEYGRTSIPLYVLYGKNKKPIILPTLLTPQILREALENLAKE